MKTSEQIVKKFGQQARVRVMGVLIREAKMLLINHSGLNEENELWLPPGGGVEFGENAIKCLEREFLEETNLVVTVGRMLFVNEFISDTIHAVELFFQIDDAKGVPRLGHDPELGDRQILVEMGFLSIDEVKNKGKNRVHRWLGRVNSFDELLAQKGFFHF